MSLLPNEPLVYERANGVVFARYANKPEIPRWIVGGDSDEINRLQGCLFSYSEWQDMMRLAESSHTLKTQMKKLLDIYYLVKDEK